ncbi:hypothetical protein [Pseudomonas sp. dw_358]|uniref:hypothetical protein n=1 Tax=Pseudomonas sp. dw_358 TaxID=2720083 RepID=UPI001BD3E08B|nr:hypothetical protein [Pseudomonas sp. dw_358]
MTTSNYQLFRQSLSNHPGLIIGFVFPFIVFASMIENASFDGWALLGLSLLPWFFIVSTAWMLRNSGSEVQP